MLNYFADGVRSDTDGMMLCMKNGDGGVPKVMLFSRNELPYGNSQDEI